MLGRLKKGDEITVIAGKDRGKRGKILRFVRQKVVVEGVNLLKRREKPRRQGQKGQVVTVAAPLHRSNVMLWCSHCGRGVRLGSKVVGSARRRVCRHCEREI